MRGEKLTWKSNTTTKGGSPPRARGEVVAIIPARGRRGITPACAGRRMTNCWKYLQKKDHPRVRGEKLDLSQQYHARKGSPPRARGEGLLQGLHRALGGITPACAGRSSSRKFLKCPARDHPRVRGEKYPVIMLSRRHTGSPPRARGEVASFFGTPHECGITPACAGRRSGSSSIT